MAALGPLLGSYREELPRKFVYRFLASRRALFFLDLFLLLLLLLLVLFVLLLLILVSFSSPSLLLSFSFPSLGIHALRTRQNA